MHQAVIAATGLFTPPNSLSNAELVETFNAYVERFNRTVRYEWLSQYHWRNLDEVRDYATQWIWRYKHERPNMALGGITPKQRLAMAA